VYNKDVIRKGEIIMNKAIYFDMDGTIAGLYQVEGWLNNLINEQTRPYREAKSLVDMRKLGKVLNTLQAEGYHIGIISWLSKNGSEEYNERVTTTKINWLKTHLGAVEFDEIKIVKYGTPKQEVVNFPEGILFDDEEPNRNNWKGTAFDVDNILEILANLI
jgi:hypothetical protein